MAVEAGRKYGFVFLVPDIYRDHDMATVKTERSKEQ
jgi:hypothetical protein